MCPDDSSLLSALLPSVSHCASLLQIQNSQLSKMKSIVLGEKERFKKSKNIGPNDHCYCLSVMDRHFPAARSVPLTKELELFGPLLITGPGF